MSPSSHLVSFFPAILKFTKDMSFTSTEEWLMALLEWVEETYPEKHTWTLHKLQEIVTEQWQAVHLETMESSCLPPNLANKNMFTLSGTYGLQINSFQDIGESSFSQLTRRKKLENENTNVTARDSTEITANASWVPKPRRCLYLTLTDGKQKVFGMELEHIPELALPDLPPGIKVKIIGPVECRRGVLHLRPRNVKLIGGFVEELAEINSVDNVLFRDLGGSESLKNLISQPTEPVLKFENATQGSSSMGSQRPGTAFSSHSLHSQATQPIQNRANRVVTTGTNARLLDRTNGGSITRYGDQQRGQLHPEVVDLSDDFDDDDELFMRIDENDFL